MHVLLQSVPPTLQQATMTHASTRDSQTPTGQSGAVSYGGTGHKWPATGAGVLGTPDLDMAYTLLEEVTINPTREPPELTQDWGHRLLEGTNKAVCEPGPRRKEK